MKRVVKYSGVIVAVIIVIWLLLLISRVTWLKIALMFYFAVIPVCIVFLISKAVKYKKQKNISGLFKFNPAFMAYELLYKKRGLGAFNSLFFILSLLIFWPVSIVLFLNASLKVPRYAEAKDMEPDEISGSVILLNTSLVKFTFFAIIFSAALFYFLFSYKLGTVYFITVLLLNSAFLICRFIYFTISPNLLRSTFAQGNGSPQLRFILFFILVTIHLTIVLVSIRIYEGKLYGINSVSLLKMVQDTVTFSDFSDLTRLADIKPIEWLRNILYFLFSTSMIRLLLSLNNLKRTDIDWGEIAEKQYKLGEFKKALECYSKMDKYEIKDHCTRCICFFEVNKSEQCFSIQKRCFQDVPEDFFRQASNHFILFCVITKSIRFNRTYKKLFETWPQTGTSNYELAFCLLIFILDCRSKAVVGNIMFKYSAYDSPYVKAVYYYHASEFIKCLEELDGCIAANSFEQTFIHLLQMHCFAPLSFDVSEEAKQLLLKFQEDHDLSTEDIFSKMGEILPNLPNSLESVKIIEQLYIVTIYWEGKVLKLGFEKAFAEKREELAIEVPESKQAIEIYEQIYFKVKKMDLASPHKFE